VERIPVIRRDPAISESKTCAAEDGRKYLILQGEASLFVDSDAPNADS
jgi:hypothetical protein